MENKEEYQTRDMGLAASFMVDGIKYLRVEKDVSDQSRRRLIFIFEDSPEIPRIVEQRANATHVASTVAYDEALRRLKSIIHSV